MRYPRDGDAGIVGQANLLVRWGLLGVGALVETGGASFWSMNALGGMAGVAFRSDGGLRAELLGTGGLRHYSHWGSLGFGEQAW